ncbi:hypothetical protein G9F71_024655 [Clostridium sp. FP2]|uniref:hypothetical protein n=1 Tax=Clostridium sp. FP2 TaxID=2724481 RepID=UPI0013E924C3|nr:hypothetical protein [Clostridium sp. FP2]MBZ9625999.1 hypothetical protein [Clostridium sp. FP2]
MNKRFRVLYLLFSLLLLLTSCSNKSVVLNLKVNNGDFSKSKSEIITSEYELKSNGGFFSRIDFDLKEGKVDWQITNSKGEIVFKGYVINENGTTYRELTYPENFLEGQLNKKQEVKPNKDSENGINKNPDFEYLPFDVGSPLGIYTLSLKPTNVEGKYTVLWSDGVVKK